MFQSRSISKGDLIGASTSSLCALHCMAAPFLFLAKAGMSPTHAEPPTWYHLIDYLFLVVSFAAIYFATKNSTKDWIRVAFWTTWIVLLVAVLNETFEAVPLPEASVYIPALLIAILHLYNHKYCKCVGNCCTEVSE